MIKKILLLCLSFMVANTMTAQNPLIDLLQQNKTAFDDIFDRPDHYEVQIIYTQIDRDSTNIPSFTSFQYGDADSRYFYPASTVKMPTAFAALEKLNRLSIIGLDKNTALRTGIGSAPQTAKNLDASAKNLVPSIAHYIKKIFLVSDNDAYNRLYEFVGQQELNETLWEKGFTATRIIHRLSSPNYNKQTNQYTNPVTFYEGDKVLYHQGEVSSQASSTLQLTNEIKGKGYENKDGKIVAEPFDFTAKNYVSLQHLHDLLQTVLFPQAVPKTQRFNLTESDYD